MRRLQASVTGNLTVSFYDAEAGSGALGPVMLSARTNPQVSAGPIGFRVGGLCVNEGVSAVSVGVGWKCSQKS